MNIPSLTAKARRFNAGFIVMLGIMMTLVLQSVRADIPDRARPSLSGPPQLAGMYKVAASTDPFFPARQNVEWFLDFGKGTAEQNSGKVAVSLRQNPNVKVRIMVWQVFPQNSSLLLGNQTGEGSKQAVALADWKIRSHAKGVILERGSYQVVLHHADPADY